MASQGVLADESVAERNHHNHLRNSKKFTLKSDRWIRKMAREEGETADKEEVIGEKINHPTTKLPNYSIPSSGSPLP